MSEEDLAIKEDLVIPGWELWFTASRSGGPGGQHANTSSTRVTLHWSVRDSSVFDGAEKRRLEKRLSTYVNADGVVQISAADSRSQHRNRQLARMRLAKEVQKALRKKKRRLATKPTRASQRRRLDEKRQRGQTKDLRKSPKKGEDW